MEAAGAAAISVLTNRSFLRAVSKPEGSQECCKYPGFTKGLHNRKITDFERIAI